MKMKVVCLIVLMNVCSTAWARIEVSTPREESQASQIRGKFETALDLHRERKVGVGLGFAGPFGVAGANIQLNFALDVGISLGYGFGRGLNAATVSAKQLIGTGAFVPYYGLGYAKWSGTGEDLSQGTRPSILGDRFLSGKERNTGEFSKNLVFPTLGVQIYKMSGDWAGSSLYAEILYLIDMEDLIGGATGALGYTYFF